MASPKSKDSSMPENEPLPGRRDGSNAKPRPRPVRRTSRYSPAEVHEIFRRFSVQRPEPKGELEHVNAFTLLVAVVLSAQATDAGVNKATRALFKVADTPQKMLALGEAKVGDYIRTIGLWRNKAKNVVALSEALIRDHGGEVLKRAGVPCGSCDAVTALERRLRPYSAKAPRGTRDEPYPRHDCSSRSIAAGGRRSVDLSGRGHPKVVRLRALADRSSAACLSAYRRPSGSISIVMRPSP